MFQHKILVFTPVEVKCRQSLALVFYEHLLTREPRVFNVNFSPVIRDPLRPKYPKTEKRANIWQETKTKNTVW